LRAVLQTARQRLTAPEETEVQRPGAGGLITVVLCGIVYRSG